MEKTIKRMWIFLAALIACMAIAVVQGGVSVHAEGQSTPLPSNWSNNTQIKGLLQGYYLNIDKGRTLNIDYHVEMNGPDNGKAVDPSHITNQYVTYNGQTYSLSDFSADRVGEGDLVTTWDNGHTEHDGFAFYTFVTVSYRDIDNTSTDLAKMQYKLFYKPGQTYDLSSFDKSEITYNGHTYRKVKQMGSFTGNTDNLTAQKNIFIFYKRQVTVKYDANGGTGTMDPETADLNATVKTKANAFKAPEGKTFAGWNTKADGSGTAYAADKDLKVSDDMTLYAQWAKKPETTPSQNNQKTTPAQGSKTQTTQNTGVKTGDTTQAMPFVAAMGAALAAVIALAAKRRHFE
ncbi:MAG: InlB B-repeat-containing protein [Pseudoramibacter sp.]